MHAASQHGRVSCCRLCRFKFLCVPAFAPSSAFQFEALRDRQEETEILVSRVGVRMVLPLWQDRRQGDASDAPPENEEGPAFIYGRSGFKVRLEWAGVGEGERPGERQWRRLTMMGRASGF